MLMIIQDPGESDKLEALKYIADTPLAMTLRPPLNEGAGDEENGHKETPSK